MFTCTDFVNLNESNLNLHSETSVNLNLIHVFIFEKTKLSQPNDLDDIYKKHQKSFLANINHPRWSVQDDKNMM